MCQEKYSVACSLFLRQGGSTTVQRESFAGENFREFRGFGGSSRKFQQRKFSLSTGGRHYYWACHYSRQRRQHMNHRCCLSRSFPSRHVNMVASINGRHFYSSLILFAPIQSRSSFPAHVLLSFPTIHESFNRENRTISNWRKFSPSKDSRYTVYFA